MSINIDNCNFRDDYFHFSNQANVASILKVGLQPSAGAASQLVGHDKNVSVSKGAKGIMGIINSFIYVFSTKVKLSEIPEEYQKYFPQFTNFTLDQPIPKDIVCEAIRRKLQDEVYFRVEIDDNQLDQAKIGGLTGYDIKLPMAIEPSKVSLITDNNNRVLSAYDVAGYIYEKGKDVDVFRFMHDDFFYLFDQVQQNTMTNTTTTVGGKHR